MHGDSSRKVAKVTRRSARVVAPLVRVDNVTAYQLPLDPFLGLDRFVMRAPRSPPHPHAGFCAVTCLFESSEAALVSRDSLGHTVLVRPGDLCWTTAGRGIVHEEVPSPADRFASGLQIFVNLPAEKKRVAPSVQHVAAVDVPVILSPGGVRVRVLAGSVGAIASPVATPVPVTLLEVRVPPGARFEHRLAPEEHALAWVLEGNGLFGGTRRLLRVRAACAFDDDGERVEMLGGRCGMRVAILAGRPLGEPVVAGGPFIMSSDAELAEAYDDFRLGRMGRLAASF